MDREAGSSSYERDQLVVDLDHLDTVERTLDRLGIRRAPTAAADLDQRLGLGLLRDLRDATDDPLDVGELLALLRQRFAAERDGWVPTMGKNREVDAVIGEGHKPMSSGDVSVSSHKPMGGAEPSPDIAAGFEAPAGAAGAGQGVCVGVVDTRPAPPSRTPGVPFRSGHAEFVRSLIRRQAPAAEVPVEGVLDPFTGQADSWSTAQAMLRLAAEHRLHVLNLSFGCFTLNGGPPLVMDRAVQRIGRDVLIVAAAGNHGLRDFLTAGRNKQSACWPAAVEPVVAVAAADPDGNVPPWSAALPWVRCKAPGVDVIGDYFTGPVLLGSGLGHFEGRAMWSGTSFAAAIVSGAVAARTVPGSTGPRAALETLLKDGTLVREF
jgi:membrane-anchored mycosin MYCP